MFSQLAAAEAGDRLAEAQLRQAELDFKRAKMLKASGVESVEFYDRAQTSLNMARANRVLSQREIERARAALGGGTAEDHARYDRAIVEQAQAQLKAAELDLSYTKIDAPVAGVVTKKSVQVGHRVAIGQPLMSVVPVDSLYVTANYKETQLTDVRVGQPAEISADVYPGYEFRGHVDSISFATGSAFALLPPENATGNWVKVVQRVPVKIVLDEQMPKDRQLRVGLSVETSIDISNQNGPLLSSALQNARRDGAIGRHPQTMSQPAPQPLVPQ
jgi:membrane fusion protein (multidrug efflux system)